MLDADGNVRAADIGITWEDNETFLHGVRVVGPNFSRPTGQEPVMSTPYPRRGDGDRNSSSMIIQPPTPATPVIVPDENVHLHCPSPETRQGYRPAAPIQWFNNKSLNWPAWFRHFRAVADVQGWSKEQRALQLVSYLDETAMNVVQELGDNELYNYDVVVRLLSDRFDSASRVSAFRSRFHGRSRRHHEDADTFSDAVAELCRVGYPQSPPELRQFVRGQSDPELKKYLWVVIRTQKDRKLQTLIEVCTDFSSLVTPTHLHRTAEQTFAVNRLSHMQRKMVTLRMSLPWVTVPHGLIGDLRNQPRRPPYNRCLRWHVEWDTICVRSPDSRMPNASLRGIVRSLIRIEGFARRHVPAGTTPGSSVSVVENLVICKPAAHVRTLPFPSNLQVGA